MKKEIEWTYVLVAIGIIWIVAALLPDYTALFNF